MFQLRALLVAVLFFVCAFAQANSNAGDIKGTILDASGANVSGATITVIDPNRGFTRSTKSQNNGEFLISLVPPGVYRLRVEATGLTTRVLEGVEVRVGDVLNQIVQLSVSAIETEISVTADPPAVETDRTQQASTVEQRRINNLPINRRNYLDFALLTPGVVETTSVADGASFRPTQTPNSGLSFGGSNGRGNGFFIDGVENYQNSGGVRPSVSQEAAQEFQINRNSFSSEFGNAFGGMINIITKSGANDLHGNAFGFLRQRNIQARNYFDPVKSPFTRVQAGATLGGAIRKDRTFYFSSFEALRRNETVFIPLLQDTSLFSRLSPLQTGLLSFLRGTGNPQFVGLANQGQALLTPANNPAVTRLFRNNSGNFPFREDDYKFSLRGDHRFSDKHFIFVRSNTTFNSSPTSAFGALDAFNRGRDVQQDDTTAMFADTYVFNPNLVMETRGMYGYQNFEMQPTDVNGPEININGFGFFGRQLFLPFRVVERHYQFLQNYSLTKGTHALRFGGDWNAARNSSDAETFFGGRFTFGSRIPLASVLQSATGDANFPNTLASILTSAGQQALLPALSEPISALQSYSLGIPELYQQGFGSPSYVNFIRRNNLYAQDTWRARPNLTLNYGLRYELEIHNAIVPRDSNNIAPRFGFAWSPGRNQKTAIRGGYGLYYSRVDANVASTADPLSGRFINQVLLTPTSTLFRSPTTNQFVTSATVYQSLLAQGVIGNRSIRESDLSQFGIRIGPNLPGSVVFGVDPSLKNPWAHQASLEIERQVGGFAVSGAWNWNRAGNIYRTSGRNVFDTGRRLPDGRPIFDRINPLLLQLNIFESTANSFYNAGILEVKRRFSRNFSLNFNYTFSKAIDETTDFNSDYSPANQLNARAERALSAYHQAHRVVMSAVYEAPTLTKLNSVAMQKLLKGWVVAPIVFYNSWRPFNVLTGVDSQNDTYVNNKRPGFLGRNMGQGPDFVTFDGRLSRRFRWSATKESRMFEIVAEGFNLLNRTNFRTVNNIVGDVPVSSLPSPIVANRGPASQPLAYSSAQNPRQFQFGLKLYW
jgi:hypothetical protein